MIKYIFFDLDETLFDFPLAERLAISETFAELGIMPTEENIKLYSRINRLCWNGLERGELTRDRLIILRFEMLFDEDIPVNVAINEAVEIAKQYGQETSGGFVNAVLAKFVPEKE